MEHEPIATRARRYQLTALDSDRDPVTRVADLLAVREHAVACLRVYDEQTAVDRDVAWCLAELATTLVLDTATARPSGTIDHREPVALRYRARVGGAVWQYLDAADPIVPHLLADVDQEWLYR